MEIRVAGAPQRLPRRGPSVVMARGSGRLSRLSSGEPLEPVLLVGDPLEPALLVGDALQPVLSVADPLEPLRSVGDPFEPVL